MAMLSGALREEITKYVSGLIEVLADELLGVYLYGSLARGCYNSVTSDIDTIVVVKDRCREEILPEILRVHQDSKAQIDVVFVTESQLNSDVYPPPVDFLVKPAEYSIGIARTIAASIEGYNIIDVPDGRKDFLLQRQDAYEAGIALFGPAPKELIRPVPWPLLTESLDYLFSYIVSHFKNPVLMLCRIAYAWTNHKLSSKSEAGEWALTALEEHWRPLIKTAMAEYGNGTARTSASSENIRLFENYCAGYISEVRKHCYRSF